MWASSHAVQLLYWNIAGYSGLLIPYRDKSGLIQGMQVRLDDEDNPERKYHWLSSRTRNFGTRSLSWIHVTGNIHAKTAYLTEGGLKGDVASFQDHDALFLCFAGINAIGQLKETLKDFSLSEEVIALDMDKQLLSSGKTEFPPLVCINRMVIDGQHRFWAYQQLGYREVKIYQNVPWVMPAAA